MSFVVFSCRNCGAPIEVQPDNLLTICTRCGTIYPAKELGDVPVYIVPSVSERQVKGEVLARMAADSDMSGVVRSLEISRSDGVYVPLFINRATVQGHWKGYEDKSEGDHKVTVWKDGPIDHEGDFPVLARKHAHEFGLSSIGRVIFNQEPVPFESITWTDIGLPVLSVDVDEQHADLAVEDDLIDRLGEEVKAANSLDAITQFDATVTIQDRFILLYPLWTVAYTFRKGSYRVAVGGGGEPVVLAAMEPVFFGHRMLHLMLGAGGILGTGILFAIGWTLIAHSNSDDAGDAAAGILAGICACFWVAWRTTTKLVASVNVERIGEDEGFFS